MTYAFPKLAPEQGYSGRPVQGSAFRKAACGLALGPVRGSVLPVQGCHPAHQFRVRRRAGGALFRSGESGPWVTFGSRAAVFLPTGPLRYRLVRAEPLLDPLLRLGEIPGGGTSSQAREGSRRGHSALPSRQQRRRNTAKRLPCGFLSSGGNIRIACGGVDEHAADYRGRCAHLKRSWQAVPVVRAWMATRQCPEPGAGNQSGPQATLSGASRRILPVDALNWTGAMPCRSSFI